MSLLFLIPIFVYGLSVLILLNRRLRSNGSLDGWHADFLIAMVIWGLLVTVFSELLGAFQAISQLWLALSWGLVFVILLVVAIKTDVVKLVLTELQTIQISLSLIDKLLVAFFFILIVALFAIAFISPANNVDSLLYHMSRVVHWAQNQSLDHYAPKYNHELLKPIWAEIAILNLRVLWGNDQPVNLVQWFSMFGSLIAVAGIASIFVKNWRAQLLTAIVAVSIPLGILESTTTQNDYVTTIWVVSIAYFVVLSQRRRLSPIEFGAMAGAFGLGLLTKGTFFVYGPVLMAWYFLILLFRKSFRRILLQGGVLVLLTILLNSGFWIRNIQTYGGPYGTTEWLSRNVPFIPKPISTLPDPNLPDENDQSQTQVDRSEDSLADQAKILSDPTHISEKIVGFISRILVGEAKIIALNRITPVQWVNDQVTDALLQYPKVFDEAWLKATGIAAWNNEDTASNPLHLLLVPVSLILLLILSRKMKVNPILNYAIVSLIAFFMIPIVIGHGVGIWGLRYQLSFWLLWAPVAGTVLTLALANFLVGYYLIAFGLLLYTLPYLFINNTKPLIGMTPWPTRVDSILTSSSNEIMFATNPDFRDEYEYITQEIRSAQCKEVGLALTSGDFEYMFWWLLDAPQSGIQLRSFSADPLLERYLVPDYQPCAVICTHCGGQGEIRGLPLVGDYGHVQLYLENSYGEP
jgi:4-amino-4-deoxy-L-arabinose transferase-like glycosyltransferase